MRGEAKIRPTHLCRAALVYVRQSTMAQVHNNTESTARQYALVERAAELGWAASAIEVIDSDLGLSGRSAEGRSGFKEVVGRVCLHEVGAIFGLEVSRLARSSADLSRLLELARLTDTLVIDADGVYDLSDINDRLVLGVKGTIAETELHILASRLDESRRAAAARGELRWGLPAGYVHDDEGAIVLDPDEGVQAAVADLFAAFLATGSAYGVVGAFAGRKFPRRPHGGSVELTWAPLTYDRVLKVLANPTYAGAYAFGRPFDAEAVGILRRSYGIPVPGVLEPDETTAADIAERLGVSHSTVVLWVKEGLLQARRTAQRYCITFDAPAEAACRARVAASPQIHEPDHKGATPEDRTPTQTADHEGLAPLLEHERRPWGLACVFFETGEVADLVNGH